ncbi:hypothetical protein [Streptomyces sp. NRRL F-5193]|uniref:hypothetical protein n=1 Tax=Streptomyces sp. NRRL F-5193 TaxID=1463860 RepID=UPI00131CCDBC|nr:hypothetical protein [Streptomyces sp. NRRL F-5193]
MTTAAGARAPLDPTWWKAPLMATLPGLPLLVGEFAFFGADGYTSGIEVILTLAAVFLVLAWFPPYRRSLRVPRILLASASLFLVAAPLVLALLMGIAMSSG